MGAGQAIAEVGMGAAEPLVLEGEGATARLGAALAAALAPGDTLCLSGPMGAGKSALARAIVRALAGAPGLEVPSPSYTLVNVYDTPRAEVWHADLYRLASVEETAEIGLADAFAEAVVLLEWPERMAGALPARRLDIALAIGGETLRTARILPRGSGWERVAEALAPWR